MSNKIATPLPDLASYNAAHRNRESHQNGWVELVGKREKKWKGFYHVIVAKPDGTTRRQQRKRIIGTKVEIPTKGQAEDIHREWLRRQAGQAVATTGRAKVADLCEDYLTMREVDWEEGTRRNTRSIFNNSIIPALGQRAVDSILPEDLKRFMGSLAHRQDLRKKTLKKGVSTSYATHVLTNLRAIFDLALERGMTPRNPARSVTVRLRVPKQAIKPDKSVFPPQHLPALLNELNIRDRLIVWVSILGATRPAELMAVTVADVGPTWIHINKAFDRWRNVKSTKTGRSRFIHLPPELAGEVHAWIATEGIGQKDLLFRGQRDGRPAIYSNIVRCMLRPAAIRAKIPVQDIDFQMLRRSFATISQFVGLDLKAVQAQLGHSKPDMTARVYMQPVDALTISQMSHLENLLRGRTAFPADVAARIGTAVSIQ